MLTGYRLGVVSSFKSDMTSSRFAALFRQVCVAGVLLNSMFHGPAQEPPAPFPVPPDTELPAWPKPTTPDLPANAPSVRSRDLELVHSPDALGGFVVRVAGVPVAIGQNRPLLGYLADGQLHWLDLNQAPGYKLRVRAAGGSLNVRFECGDADGGHWLIDQQFHPGPIPGAIDIRTAVTVDREREVAFLPMLLLFPGGGTFGAQKGQGLLAGLEYLENEPSSSEADVIGPASRRQVPDNLKLTFPLMVVEHNGRYVALSWKTEPQFCAVYDSPDRLCGSGAHVMGLLFPGSNGKNRQEGNLLPRSAERLQAGRAVTLYATLLGGLGQTVVPAVKQYVSLRGLPELPAPVPTLEQYVKQTAGGWLDSRLREGNLFRHAIAGGNFPPMRAADAAVWLDWLARETREPALAARLKETAQGALTGIPPEELNVSGVGHVRFPVGSLLYGHVAETAAHAEQAGRALLGRFESDLSIKYHPRDGGPDFSKTHFSREANGLTSRVVQDLLEAAAFAGDRELLDAALQRLGAMSKFRNAVPRGAQTWECPLHTPDILASAQMVRAYTLGYELSGDEAFLEQARYWAWTGVPFVYLVNPAAQPVGLYATIAVFGATQWKAPVWLGLPVQWCGLVYADALYRLERHDPTGPWRRLADGITASGIQQSWPTADTNHQGLLPDSFVLRSQHRNGPAINPATVQACAIRYYGQPPVYDFRVFRGHGLRVHAPGAIQDARETAKSVSFRVNPSLEQPYWVLINGLSARPQVRVDGKGLELAAPNQYVEHNGWLILRLEGRPRVEVEF